jgi:hypothetical protein
MMSASEVKWLNRRLNLVFREGTLYRTTYQTGIPRIVKIPVVIKLSEKDILKGNPY